MSPVPSVDLIMHSLDVVEEPRWPLDTVLELPHGNPVLLHLTPHPVDELQSLIVDVVADEEVLVLCRPVPYLGKRKPLSSA